MFLHRLSQDRPEAAETLRGLGGEPRSGRNRANLTSSAGATEWTYVYEPYGTARTETRVNNKAPVSPMKFDGQYFDSATSLYHLRARQYDAAAGRFLALDPIPNAVQELLHSPYIYADDQPTVLVDPSGMWTGGICGSIGGTIFHISIHSKGCVVVSSSGQLGITGSGGPGYSTAKFASLGASATLQVSSAPCVEDLGGPFIGGGGTGEGITPVGGVFAGTSRGHVVGGAEGGVGIRATPAAEGVPRCRGLERPKAARLVLGASRLAAL